MSPWRSKKGIAVGPARLDALVEPHLRILTVFRDIVNDPAIYDTEADQFDPDFLAIAEFRYYLYLRLILDESKSATAILPPWDVAVIFYAHLLFPTKLCDDLVQGIWGLKQTDQPSLSEVLRRFTFPIVQLASLSLHSQWSDNFSCFEWEQRYPRVPYQPWVKAREGRIVRLAQSRTIVAITVRCPNCGASMRCGVVEWKGFRTGEKQIPCRRSNCQPVKYTQLHPQFKSPWDSPQELAEAIIRAMSGADTFVLSPELQTKNAFKCAAQRYEKFMMLMKSTRTPERLQVLAPTADIDLCWRTHRAVPSQYRQWCAEQIGRIVEDDETGGHQIFEGGCEELTATENMWLEAYKEQYRQLKKSILERMFGIGGKQASRRISRMKGKTPAVDIPKFNYDPTAYSTAAVLSDVPERDSSINAPAKSEIRMPPRRYTADGTMLPVEGKRSRGSFVPTMEGSSRPAISNTRSKRRSSRHSKRVSVLPAIKSMDSMMGDSDGSGEQDAKQAEQVENETGLHHTKSPTTFSDGSLSVSTASPTSPTFSSNEIKESPQTSPEQAYESISTPSKHIFTGPGFLNRHERSQSMGLPTDRPPMTGKRQAYGGRPDNLRGPPVSMHQRQGSAGDSYGIQPGSGGRLGSASRPGSSGGPNQQQPITGFRQQNLDGIAPSPNMSTRSPGYPPRSFRSNSMGTGGAPAGIRLASSGSAAPYGGGTRPERSRANSLGDQRPSSSRSDYSNLANGGGYVAYDVGGNVGWMPPQSRAAYTGTGRSFSLGGYNKERAQYQGHGNTSPGGYMGMAGGEGQPGYMPAPVMRRMSGDVVPDGGNVEFGGGGRWSEGIGRAVPMGVGGSGYEGHSGSRYVGQQRARQYQSPY